MTMLEKEDKKLRTYSEICDKLSVISPSATDAVTTTMSTIIQKRASGQERVDEGTQVLGSLWNGIFGALKREMTDVFDAELRKGLQDLQQKRSIISAEVMSSVVESLKKVGSQEESGANRSETTSSRHGPEKRKQISDGSTRERKRARTSPKAPEQDRRIRTEDVSSELEEMRATIKALSRENKEVGAQSPSQLD